MSTREGPVFTYSLPGGGLTQVSYATVYIMNVKKRIFAWKNRHNESIPNNNCTTAIAPFRGIKRILRAM